MLEEIIAGQNDPEYLAYLALGHLRAKTSQLRLALKERSVHITAFCSVVNLINCVLSRSFLLDDHLQDIGRQQPELLQAVARWETIPGRRPSCRMGPSSRSRSQHGAVSDS